MTIMMPKIQLYVLLFVLPTVSDAFTTISPRSAERVQAIRRCEPWRFAGGNGSVTWQRGAILERRIAFSLPILLQDWHNGRSSVERNCSALFASPSRFDKQLPADGVSRIRLWLRSLRKVTRSLVLAALLAFSFHSPTWAVSGGRAGGSFGPSSSSSQSSYSPSSSSSYRSRPSTTRVYHHHTYSPSVGVYWGPSWPWFSPTRIYGRSVVVDAPATGMSVSDFVLLTGTGALLVYGFTKKKWDSSDDHSSALGPGVSVASITIALDVPDRDDPGNILAKLKRIAVAADTGTRRGVQALISNVALELMRQQRAIKSAQSSSQHFASTSEAEREFQRISVQERSKFDRETVNKYGGIDIGQAGEQAQQAVNDKATAAVVTISLSIQGDRTKLPQIRSRQDVADSLSRIAADAPVEDCLLSAEVLWAPEERSDRLTDEDIIADHPNLYPLY